MADDRTSKPLKIENGDIITISAVKGPDGASLWKIEVEDKDKVKSPPLTMPAEDVLTLTGDGKNAQIKTNASIKPDGPRPVIRNDASETAYIDGSVIVAKGTSPVAMNKYNYDFASITGNGGNYSTPHPDKSVAVKDGLQTVTTKDHVDISPEKMRGKSQAEIEKTVLSSSRPTQSVSLEEGAILKVELDGGRTGPTFTGGDTEASLKANRDEFEKYWSGAKGKIESGRTNNNQNTVKVTGAPVRTFEEGKTEPAPAKEETHPMKLFAKEKAGQLERALDSKSASSKTLVDGLKAIEGGPLLITQMNALKTTADKIAKQEVYDPSLTETFGKQLNQLLERADTLEKAAGGTSQAGFANKFLKATKSELDIVSDRVKTMEAEKPAPEKPAPEKPVPETPKVDPEVKAKATKEIKEAGAAAAAEIDRIVHVAPPRGRKGFFDANGGAGNIPPLKGILEKAQDAAGKLVNDKGEIDPKQMKVFQDSMKQADVLLSAFIENPKNIGKGDRIARDDIRTPLGTVTDKVNKLDAVYEGLYKEKAKPAPGKGAGEMNLDAKEPTGENPVIRAPGVGPGSFDAGALTGLADTVIKQIGDKSGAAPFKENVTQPEVYKGAAAQLDKLKASATVAKDKPSPKSMEAFHAELLNTIRKLEKIDVNTDNTPKQVKDLLIDLIKDNTKMGEIKNPKPEPDKQKGARLTTEEKAAIAAAGQGIPDDIKNLAMKAVGGVASGTKDFNGKDNEPPKIAGAVVKNPDIGRTA